MSSSEIKARIHQLVDESDDQILQDIERMLKKHQQGQFWDEEEIDALNRDIEESEKEFAQGKFHSQEEAIKISEGWKPLKK